MTTPAASITTRSTARPALLAILFDAIEAERRADADDGFFDPAATWRAMTSGQRRAMGHMISGFLTDGHRAFLAHSYPCNQFCHYVSVAALGMEPRSSHWPWAAKPAAPAVATFRLAPAPRPAARQALLWA